MRDKRSKRLEAWLAQYGATPRARAEWEKALGTAETLADTLRRRREGDDGPSAMDRQALREIAHSSDPAVGPEHRLRALELLQAGGDGTLPGALAVAEHVAGLSSDQLDAELVGMLR